MRGEERETEDTRVNREGIRTEKAQEKAKYKEESRRGSKEKREIKMRERKMAKTEVS